MNLIAGKYEVVKKLGQGGFGAVYLARHLDLKIDYAVKVIADPTKAKDEKFLERFNIRQGAFMKFNHLD